MHELHVGAEQTRLLELHDRARAGRVHRDRQPECARSLPILLRHLDGERAARSAADAHRADIARADAEREHAVVRHPLALDAREPGEIHQLVVRHALRRAIGEASTDAHVAHGRELGIGMLGAAHVVRPVMHRGHARAEGFGDAEPDAAVAVLGHHELAQPIAHREVADRIDIGAHERTEERRPQVPVRVDDARHADHAVCVDRSRPRIEPRPDRDDRAVAHMHVAAREIARCWDPWSARSRCE